PERRPSAAINEVVKRVHGPCQRCPPTAQPANRRLRQPAPACQEAGPCPPPGAKEMRTDRQWPTGPNVAAAPKSLPPSPLAVSPSMPSVEPPPFPEASQRPPATEGLEPDRCQDGPRIS